MNFYSSVGIATECWVWTGQCGRSSDCSVACLSLQRNSIDIIIITPFLLFAFNAHVFIISASFCGTDSCHHGNALTLLSNAVWFSSREFYLRQHCSSTVPARYKKNRQILQTFLKLTSTEYFSDLRQKLVRLELASTFHGRCSSD